MCPGLYLRREQTGEGGGALRSLISLSAPPKVGFLIYKAEMPLGDWAPLWFQHSGPSVLIPPLPLVFSSFSERKALMEGPLLCFLLCHFLLMIAAKQTTPDLVTWTFPFMTRSATALPDLGEKPRLGFLMEEEVKISVWVEGQWDFLS